MGTQKEVLSVVKLPFYTRQVSVPTVNPEVLLDEKWRCGTVWEAMCALPRKAFPKCPNTCKRKRSSPGNAGAASMKGTQAPHWSGGTDLRSEGKFSEVLRKQQCWDLLMYATDLLKRFANIGG